jgi:hypothetical protein
VPYERNEFQGGCTLLRLCTVRCSSNALSSQDLTLYILLMLNMSKYMDYTCPNQIFGFNPTNACSHIHDIKISSRFVAKQHLIFHNLCKLVEEKRLPC